MPPIRLAIGGYRLLLQDEQERPRLHWPAQAYDQFLTGDPGFDLRFGVSLSPRLPDIARGRELYRAEDGSWTLFERLEGFLLEALDPLTGRPSRRALLSPDYATGTIFMLEEDGAWNPSKAINPVVEVCLLTRLALDGGLMLHAAGVDWRGDGLVFTGPSGAGKSTLSGLFVDRGALILNDERIIVDGGETPVVHGTPWCGSNPVMNNARAPLRGLYFIGHGSGGHRLNSLSRARAAALCVRQAFMPDWDAAAVEATVASAERLSSMIRPLEYAFLKEPGAVDHLLDEASRHGKPLQARVS